MIVSGHLLSSTASPILGGTTGTEFRAISGLEMTPVRTSVSAESMARVAILPSNVTATLF